MTDQTSRARSAERLRARRRRARRRPSCAAARPAGVRRARAPLDGRARRAPCCDLKQRGRRTSSTTATTCAARRVLAGVETAFATSPASCRPTSARSSARARGRSAGSRCRAIPHDIAVTDEAVLELFPDDAHLHRWIDARAQERVQFQGLPARICWLGYGERAQGGPRASTSSCARARSRRRSSSAATTSTRGSVASPNRETEAHEDGSDAIADWPFLNALVNSAAGATWVSVPPRRRRRHRLLAARRHGRRRRRHRRARRGASSACCTTDPAMGVMRHADAGYSEAIEFAAAHGPRVPHRDRLTPSLVDRHRRARLDAARIRARRAGLGLVHDAAVVVRRARRLRRRARRSARPGSTVARRRRLDAGGRLVTPGPRRPAHAPRLRRLARARVRPAQPGPVVPRDPAGGRRHPGDGARDARRQRRCARRRRALARLDRFLRARRHRRRGQDRLRPDARRRASACSRPPPVCARARPIDLSPTLLAHVPPVERRRAIATPSCAAFATTLIPSPPTPKRSTSTATPAPSRSTRRGTILDGRAPRPASGCASTPSSSRTPAPPSWPPSWARVGRAPRAALATARRRSSPPPASSATSCPARRLTLQAALARRRAASSPPAVPSLSAPTAIPARRCRSRCR